MISPTRVSGDSAADWLLLSRIRRGVGRVLIAGGTSRVVGSTQSDLAWQEQQLSAQARYLL